MLHTRMTTLAELGGWVGGGGGREDICFCLFFSKKPFLVITNMFYLMQTV